MIPAKDPAALLPVHADAEVLQQEHGPGHQGQQARNPGRDRQPDQQVETEDKEEEGKEEMGHTHSLASAPGPGDGVLACPPCLPLTRSAVG